MILGTTRQAEEPDKLIMSPPLRTVENDRQTRHGSGIVPPSVWSTEKNMVVTTLEVQNEDAKIATVEHHARASSKGQPEHGFGCRTESMESWTVAAPVWTLLFGAKKSQQIPASSEQHLSISRKGVDLQCQ